MRTIKNLATVLWLLGSLPSCTLLGGEELQPAFIYIDSFEVSSDPATEGAPTHKIVDAWVYVNGLQLGVFEVPVTIPVLDTGLVTVSIFPGVKENGFSTVGNIYPFLQGYESDRTLTPFETDSFFPAITYYDDLTFIFLERFELGNAFSELSGSDTGFNIITDPALVLEGDRSALGVIEGDNSLLKVSTGPLLFPPVGQSVWVEIDYTGNTEFEVWLNGNYTGGIPISIYILSVPPRDTWNKIYVNLTPKIRELQADTYNLEIRAGKNDTLTSSLLYFDNFKIIAF